MSGRHGLRRNLSEFIWGVDYGGPPAPANWSPSACAVTIGHPRAGSRWTPITERLTYICLTMIRIAISLAAYQALASTLAEGREARPPEPLEVGEGVGMWIDHAALAALKIERWAGERYSEVILRLCSVTTGEP
jgi:hypothetical protein